MNIPYERSFIAGRWLGNHALPAQKVTNPANQKVLKSLAVVDDGLIDMAIAEAVRAQAKWRELSCQERRDILWAWHARLSTKKQELAELIALEGGKVIAEAQAEVDYALSFIDWSAEQAMRVYGCTFPAMGSRHYTIKQPLGVVAAITPWNFPAAMVTRKVAPALAVGCAVILKPSEETPLTALMLAALAKEAGLPSGLFNVLVGEADSIGRKLCASHDIRGFSFTGSTEVGRLLLRQCADTVKHCVMELGGNAPLVVCEDADIEKAVNGLMASRFRHTGQVCVSANRIFVHKTIEEAFVSRLHDKVDALVMGDTLNDQVHIGPLINMEAVQRIDGWVQEALQRGAVCICGGQPAREYGAQYYQPTILTQVQPTMSVAQHEIFGPVAAIQTYEDEQELITHMNNTHQGLAGYLYTESLAKARHLSESMEVGMVGINTTIISNSALPFGGIKQSGLGMEGAFLGVESYLTTKAISEG